MGDRMCDSCCVVVVDVGSTIAPLSDHRMLSFTSILSNLLCI